MDLAAEPARPIVVAGAHGGAGASTLAALLDPAWDLGAVALRRPGRPLPAGLSVVLVARCTVASAWRSVVAVSVLADQGTGVAVLAVTGDGLPEPDEAAYRFRVLEGRVGGVVRVRSSRPARGGRPASGPPDPPRPQRADRDPVPGRPCLAAPDQPVTRP